MSQTPHFALGWHGGSSAEIDLHALEGGCYMLRYSSPFRSTMRPPARELAFQKPDLDQIGADLDEVAGRIGATQRGGGGNGQTAVGLDDLVDVGRQTFELVLPRHVRADLNHQSGFFVEIGTDETLLHLPWELMHDGDEFICLKHHVGRFVNLPQTLELNQRPPPAPGAELGDLRVLVVSVPNPRVPGTNLPTLKAAAAETEAILETLSEIGIKPSLLAGPEATRVGLLKALREQYHIIHFAGHALFDTGNPAGSGLYLDDDLIRVGALTQRLADQESMLLCVVNACETTRGGAAPADEAPGTASWSDQYNIYGLARAFLETGAYLLGSRWRLEDGSAKIFAQHLYRSLLKDGKPVGESITMARQAVKMAADVDDYSWASYVFYGDPRLCFRRIKPERRRLRRRAQVPQVDGEIVRRLAGRYDEIRATMPSGPERTAKMSEVVREAVELATTGDSTKAIEDLLGGGPGERIVGLGFLQTTPAKRHFEPLVKVITTPASGFEQYIALQAARAMVSDLPTGEQAALGDALRSQFKNQDFYGTDRQVLASEILARIGETSSQSTSTSVDA